MDEIYIKIPGKPIAKKTHRTKVFLKNKGGRIDVQRHTYFPQGKEASDVRKLLKDQYTGEPLDTGVFVRFLFHMPIPSTWNKTQKAMARDGRLLPIGKPDVSNLAKFYEDCMNGIIYTDDSRIIWVSPIKKYDDESYTEIFITPFSIECYARFQRLAA